MTQQGTDGLASALDQLLTDPRVVGSQVSLQVRERRPGMASVWEPTGYAATVFREALARHGVRVIGHTASRATPADARPVADHASMTLRELLIPFLKLSNNGHAEVLLKAMGRQAYGNGSWTAGIRAESSALAGLGVKTSTLRVVDGSGLSRQDLLTSQQLTNLLVAAQGKPWFAAWYDALPIAGVSDRFVGGTLRSRMVGVTSLLDAVGVTLATSSASSASPSLARSVPEPATATNAAGEEVECSWIKAC